MTADPKVNLLIETDNVSGPTNLVKQMSNIEEINRHKEVCNTVW
jgi:hypothetical protein